MNTLDLLFTWFLAATLRGTLLAGLVLLVQIALRHRIPARWRYALWLPVVFVLAAPALPQSRWSLERLFVQHPSAQSLSAPLPTITPQQVPSPVHTVSEPPPAPRLALPPAPINWRRILAAAWMAGTVGAIGFMLAAYTRVIRLFRRGKVEADASLADLISEAATSAGLSTSPRLLVSSFVQSPAVCGLFRPTLLLPAEFPRGFKREEAHLVLLHEMTHLLRRDLPANWLLCLIQALHWCNPALAFVFRRIRADREMACDAQVLALNDRDSRADYGHALLKLQSTLGLSGFSLGFVGIFGQASSMRSRIRAIAGYRCPSPRWGALGALVVAVVGITGATRAQIDSNEPPKPAGSATDSREIPIRAKVTARKLESIILPKLELNDTLFLDALAYLQSQSALSDPEKTGVNIYYTPVPLKLYAIPPLTGAPNPDPNARLTVEMDNVPLGEAIRYVAALAGHKFRITDDGVEVVSSNELPELITKEWRMSSATREALGYRSGESAEEFMTRLGMEFPFGSSIIFLPNSDKLIMKGTWENLRFIDRLNDPKNPPFTDAQPLLRSLQHSLDTIILDQLDLKKATISEAVDTLNRLGVESDPNHKGVSIDTDLDQSAAYPPMTLSLRKVSLSQAIRTVASVCGLNYEVNPTSVRFTSLRPLAETYASRQWTVSQELLLTVGCQPGTSIQDFLVYKGIDFPHGARMKWRPEKHELSMNNSPENIQATEALLGLSAPANASK